MSDNVKAGAQQVDESTAAPTDALPKKIGRYRVERMLGRGGFGTVYLAHDDQLDRRVAVKVPFRQCAAELENAQTYIAEGRVLANLDHPNIVPVHDLGRTEDGLPFIVSKYVEGTTLATKIKEGRLPCIEVIDLVATIAEALHYAHRKGLVHRDIKPGNILLDATGKPFVADFGLAMKEEDLGKEIAFAGTPAYMSPEQVRCEGHRVDGRSDIFSLGVVFYELLTGQRPFRANRRDELLTQIATAEPRPPRQIDDAIPRELERICLKALSKRASERYTTATDLADDLRHFFEESTAQYGQAAQARVQARVTLAPAPPSTPGPSQEPALASDQRPIKIVPKGLRSFDANDADFFLELLPGPRDREGLPDSVRFWKTRIEQTDPDKTFSVGLIYGPSGCGKSSLVKAALVPRLADNVATIYVEATALETENRLLKALRKYCPEPAANMGLLETLISLRRGPIIPAGKKVLIILDQFEQWLHARREQEHTELVKALRQCDGARVQCLVMVRDDFWLTLSRFMRELEVKLLQDHNIALVDLFDRRHARKVLAAFGRAFGALSEPQEALAREQKAFLDQALAGLAQGAKVIPVRLALFAEMVKGKPWTAATLEEVGGMEGVGATFLEETFAATTAQPQHRLHQRAAQAVLKALLPETGTPIKGNMRSYVELLEVSGYANRADDFGDLIRILDGELRLITPTDPEGKDEGGTLKLSGRYYQLTHDYLVPSLRDWLTRKQKETRRGRAELRLAERTTAWNAKPENRNLPSWWEWANLLLFTRHKKWTPPEGKMMRKATVYHAVRGFVLAAVLVLLGLMGWDGLGRIKAHALRDRLLVATTADVPSIVGEMAPYRRWIDPLLQEALARADSNDRRKELHLNLALLPVEPAKVKDVYRHLLLADPQEVAVIRQELYSHRQELIEQLWQVLENRNDDQDQRLRAACALALYDGTNARWNKVSAEVAAMLVTQNSLVIGIWTDILRPVEEFLFDPLAAILEDKRRNDAERSAATNIYADYAKADPGAYAALEKRLAQEIPPRAEEMVRDDIAKKRANIALALLRMDQYERMRPALRLAPDPTARSYLIHLLAPSKFDPKRLVGHLEKETEVSVRRALVLGLGEFDVDQLPPGQAKAWMAELLRTYRDDPDPGIHGAVEWLLRRWDQNDKLKEIQKGLTTGKAEGARNWYITRQGQAMMIVSQPGVFWMGEGESRRKVQITRSYAIAAREVMLDQFLLFRKDHPFEKGFVPIGDCPVVNISWYDAAEYCNWLNQKEGISHDQWCYLPNDKGQYADGMKLVANSVQRTGYRMPTDAEWEYACRAGSITDFSFGETEMLAGKYAWYNLNSNTKSHSAGMLKPNDLGLFDMHGNAWEWCQGIFKSLQPGDEEIAQEDKEDILIVRNTNRRALRGGSFLHSAVGLRSAERNWVPSSERAGNFGFRLARTVR